MEFLDKPPHNGYKYLCLTESELKFMKIVELAREPNMDRQQHAERTKLIKNKNGGEAQ